MRDGFRDIVAGWMLTDDVESLAEFIEASAAFATAHGPLEPDEEATVRMMIETQVVRGIARGDFEPFIPASDVEHFRRFLTDDGEPAA